MRGPSLRIPQDLGNPALELSKEVLCRARAANPVPLSRRIGFRPGFRMEVNDACGHPPSSGAPDGRGTRGSALTGLMGIRDADLETVRLSSDPRFIALIERSRALYKPGSGIPLEEIRRKYGLAPKAGRKPARKRARKPRSSRP